MSAGQTARLSIRGSLPDVRFGEGSSEGLSLSVRQRCLSARQGSDGTETLADAKAADIRD